MTEPLSTTDVALQLAQAAREISAPDNLDEALQRIVDVTANSLLPEIDAVGITLKARDGTLTTTAASQPLVRELDNLQYAAAEGPCVQAIEDCAVVHVDHLRHEQRWPRFVPEAIRLGVRAQMGVALFVGDKALGGLNMYSLSSDTISEESQQVAELFAAHAALALGATQHQENLTRALATREAIGQATGLLMGRLGISADAAFSYLTRISSTTQTKVRDVAQGILDDHVAHHVVDTGGPTRPDAADA